jgi:hypothetical protein
MGSKTFLCQGGVVTRKSGKAALHVHDCSGGPNAGLLHRKQTLCPTRTNDCDMVFQVI